MWVFISHVYLIWFYVHYSVCFYLAHLFVCPFVTLSLCLLFCLYLWLCLVCCTQGFFHVPLYPPPHTQQGFHMQGESVYLHSNAIYAPSFQNSRTDAKTLHWRMCIWLRKCWRPSWIKAHLFCCFLLCICNYIGFNDDIVVGIVRFLCLSYQLYLKSCMSNWVHKCLFYVFMV